MSALEFQLPYAGLKADIQKLQRNGIIMIRPNAAGLSQLDDIERRVAQASAESKGAGIFVDGVTRSARGLA